MNLKKNIKTAFVLGILFLSNTLFAQDKNEIRIGELAGQINTITTAVPFLMIAPDARAGAMGDGGVASTPDHSSMHWNPAKISFAENPMGIGVSYSPWLRALVPDINLSYVSGYYQLDETQSIGASLLYFSLGDIVFTDFQGETAGQFRPNEFAIDGAYARKLSDKFSTGISLRYIYSNLTGGQFVNGGQETKPGQSVASDISFYYQDKIGRNGDQLALGMNLSNIGAKISYTESTDADFIPINLRLGGAYTMELDEYNTLAFTLDFNKLMVPTPPIYMDSIDPVTGEQVILSGKRDDVPVVTGMFNSFSDAPGGFNEEIREIAYSLGMEYWYDKQFALRAGYFHEHETKGNRKYITFGAGLKYNVFGVDFAYLVPASSDVKSPLENTLRFTLYFDFQAFEEQNKR